MFLESSDLFSASLHNSIIPAIGRLVTPSGNPGTLDEKTLDPRLREDDGA
jgi:hypothetical protein